jgi:glycosyltransferase involved in cell wall biosynthesis
MNRPNTVTVIIPAYNAASTVARALASVLMQSRPVDQIIVIDDCSTDDTAQIVRSFVDRQVELIMLPSQSGVAVARNAGIDQAWGEYLAFLDADDEWHENKNLQQLKVISAHPQMTFVSCHAVFVSSRKDVPTIVNSERRPATGIDAWKTLLAYSYVTASSVLARRSAVIAAGKFNPESCPAEDQDLWIRLARLGEVGFLNAPLVRYHDTLGSEAKRRPAVGRAKVLSIVKRYLAEAGDYVTPKERRRILGLRYASAGRTAYAEGDLRNGIHFILRAIALGYEPYQLLQYLLIASPPARLLKRCFRKSPLT